MTIGNILNIPNPKDACRNALNALEKILNNQRVFAMRNCSVERGKVLHTSQSQGPFSESVKVLYIKNFIIFSICFKVIQKFETLLSFDKSFH